MPNWRYLIARAKWLINIPAQIRAKERERCIQMLCRYGLATITASTVNGRLEEQWIRSLLQPHADRP